MKVAFFEQFFGCGDALYCQTIAHKFISDGYSVIWPISDHYYDAFRNAYPKITWIPQSIVQPEYFMIKDKRELGNGITMVPIRWSDSYMNVPYKDVMKAKYDMYDLDWRIWKEHAMWERNYTKESELMKVLGIDGTPFNLINKRFGTNAERSIQLEVNNYLKNVEMTEINGYSLFDWTSVLYAAAEIHTVSTSLLFMMEILELVNPIHLYCRAPIEKDFSFVDYIFTKPYILHP